MRHLLSALLAGAFLIAPVHTAPRLEVDPLAVGGLTAFRAQHRVGNGAQASLFGQEFQGDFEHGPVVLYRLNQRWQKAGLGAGTQLGWVHVEDLPLHGVVGVLDSDVESTGWELTVLRRPDSKSHWEVSSELRKPYYLATFDQLTETAGGELLLDVVLDEDYGASVSPGRYRARSSDLARTWSSFERVGTTD